MQQQVETYDIRGENKFLQNPLVLKFNHLEIGLP